ncbi:MFS transporter [Candidatus Microgenomates bacterium]|nr:MFS transporter [Candidatus Microgenomates bacterium]
MPRQMARNIRLLRVYRLLFGSILAMPVVVLFFRANGLDQTQIFLLQSIFSLALILFEVPSGYFADRYGRRTSLMLGGLAGVAGWTIYSLSHGFWGLVPAEFVLAVSVSFISGADSALAYDSLLAVDRAEEYRRFETRTFIWSGAAGALAALVGGPLGSISLRGTIAAQILVALPMPLLAWQMVEPPRVMGDPSKAVAQNIRQIVRYALRGHQEIKWLIFYGAVVSSLTYTMVWLYQPYFESVGIQLPWFGLLWAVLVGSPLLVVRYVERYEAALGKRGALVSFVLIGFTTYVVIGSVQTVWVLPAMLGFSFIRAVFTPTLRDYVNSLIESSIRATVLSVQALVARLLYVAAGPLIGWVMDAYSLQDALLFSAALYGLLGAYVLLMMRKYRLL